LVSWARKGSTTGVEKYAILYPVKLSGGGNKKTSSRTEVKHGRKNEEKRGG